MHQIVDRRSNLGISEHALCVAQSVLMFRCFLISPIRTLEKLTAVLGDHHKIVSAIAAPFVLIAITAAAVAGALEDGYSALNDGNYPAALQLFRPLANEGNVSALKAIAIINDYCLAADKGNGLARFSLGFIYERGLGLPQDYVRAYMWFSLAAAQGTKGAEEWRERLAARMSPAQIAEAQRLAREWSPKP